MARFHWWSFLVNEQGQPIENADVSIYLAGTTDATNIYTEEYAGNPVSSTPQIKTLQNGYFEFWLPDINDPYGYSPGQKFKIYWKKTGLEEGTIDYIDIFPPVLPVNELDNSADRNKSVSNLLAYQWEQHRLNNSYEVHGIEKVDLNDEDDEEVNKLVSNPLSIKWDNHSEYDILGDEPHNIKRLDLSKSADNPYLYDRVISYHQGQKWNTHSEKLYTQSPHNIKQVDEEDSDTIKNKLVSNNIIRTALYEKASKVTEVINPSGWVLKSDGSYEVTISHDMQLDFPSVQLWDIDEGEIFYPEKIISMDEFNIRIVNNENVHSQIIIIG